MNLKNTIASISFEVCFHRKDAAKKILAQFNHELWAHSQPTIFHKNPTLSGGNGGTSAGSHDVTHLATRTMGKARGVFENKVPHSMVFHPTVKKLKWLFFCKKKSGCATLVNNLNPFFFAMFLWQVVPGHGCFGTSLHIGQCGRGKKKHTARCFWHLLTSQILHGFGQFCCKL